MVRSDNLLGKGENDMGPEVTQEVANEAIKVAHHVMDWGIFWTIIGVGLALVAVVYQFLRNFKADIKEIIAGQDKKFDSFERRFESIERKFEVLENRIFQIAMGKTLKSLLQEEKGI